jgi:hypothetical protein
VDLKTSLIALAVTYLVASIINNFDKSFHLNLDGWVWSIEVLAMVILFGNVLLNYFLKGILRVNPYHEDSRMNNYIIKLDRESGKKLYEKEADFALLRANNNQIVILLSLLKIEEEEADKTGIVKMKIGEFEVDSKDFEETIGFSLWASYCDKYDKDEVAQFIYRRFQLTGEFVSYQAYLLQEWNDQAPSWMHRAESEIYEEVEKIFDDAAVKKPVSDDEIFDLTVDKFLAIANKEFKPEMLSNIIGFEFKRCDEEEDSVVPADDDGEKVSINQNK